jgi:putative oxidoreductase
MNTLKKYGPYVFIILPALAFAAAGLGKLMSTPMLHQSFSTMGLPSWFGYFIGACELAGAIGLLIPKTRKLAAAGLAIIMVGAVYFHITYSVPSPVPAIILLILLLLTIWWKWQPKTN